MKVGDLVKRLGSGHFSGPPKGTIGVVVGFQNSFTWTKHETYEEVCISKEDIKDWMAETTFRNGGITCDDENEDWYNEGPNWNVDVGDLNSVELLKLWKADHTWVIIVWSKSFAGEFQTEGGDWSDSPILTTKGWAYFNNIEVANESR